jgi:16S rRNA processing protein RimM
VSERTAPPFRVGRIVKPHGLKGEVVLRGAGLDAAQVRQLGTVRLVRENGAVIAQAKIETVRAHGPDLLVRFSNAHHPEQAGELRGLWVEADRSSLPDAGPGRVYHFDLLGLEVVEQGGRALGRVRDIVVTGANEVLVVEGETGEILIPYHAGTVLGWDPAASKIFVRLPEGLLDIYRKPASD